MTEPNTEHTAPRTEPNTGPQQFAQQRWVRPEDSTEFILVRHGASQPYVPGEPFPLVDGQGDPPLAPNGHEQAAAVSRRLASEPIEALYVTSMQRTAQTFAPLARALSLSPSVEPELREVALGEWESGRIRQFAAEQHPLYVRMTAERRWEIIPGAESSEALTQRCMAALERIARAHAGRLVAACVHGGVIDAVAAHIVGADPFSFLGSENCSVTQIVRAPDRWHLRRFNDCAHLDGPLHHG